MSLDEFIKYFLWIAVFAIALIGLYTLFRSLGVI